MIVTKENITSVIPQRQPFVMVDQLIYSDEKTSRSQLLVVAENLFTIDGKFSEPGILENIAQTAAARAGYFFRQQNIPVQTGYIGAVKNFEVFSLPEVNDLLETEVVVINQVFDVTVILGTVKCKENIVAQCEMKIFIPQTK